MVELPNDWRHRILGKKEVNRKSQNWVETQAGAKSPLQSLVFPKTVRTYAKADIEIFWSCSILLDFLIFCKFISNTFISYARLKLPKNRQVLSNSLRLNFCYLKITHFLHRRYHPTIIGHILKNKQKNKCVCIHLIIRLNIMKMKMKMKNRSHRYDINRPR